MPISHQNCMATRYNNVKQHCYFIANKAYISKNSNHHFLGLMGLLIRKKFVISSSSTTSSSIASFLPLSLSLLLLLSRYNKVYYKFFLPRYYRYSKTYNKASYINTIKPNKRDINRSNIKDIVVFFLTRLLSLFISLKIANSR